MKPRCYHTTSRGFRCKKDATPYSVKNNPDRPEEHFCEFHSEPHLKQTKLLEQAREARRQSRLKPHELLRLVIESNPIAFMQPYLDALGIRIVFLPDDKDPAIVHPTAIMDPTSQGTVLYGVSKDGQVIITKHKDLEAQQRAAERLFDRVYGKPKQTNIIAGAAQNEDPHIVPFDDKRKAEVAAILEAAKKPSHQVTKVTNNPASNN